MTTDDRKRDLIERRKVVEAVIRQGMPPEVMAAQIVMALDDAQKPTDDERKALTKALQCMRGAYWIRTPKKRDEEIPPAMRTIRDMLERLRRPVPSGGDLLEAAERIGASDRSRDFDVATSRPLAPEPQTEPTDAQVESVARAVFDSERRGNKYADMTYAEVRSEYEADARAALRAAAEEGKKHAE